MRRIAPRTWRRLLWAAVITPLGWLALCLVAPVAVSAVMGVGIVLANANETTPRVPGTASVLQKMNPLYQLIDSSPVHNTLQLCADLRPVSAWVSGSCLIADTLNNSADAASQAGTAYQDLASGTLMRNGTIDLPAVRHFGEQAMTLRDNVRIASDNIDRLRTEYPLWKAVSTWLLNSENSLNQLDSAMVAAHQLPQWLGADGTRRYFVGLTSQAESRAGGGLLGMYAVVTIDQGHLTIEHLGSNLELPTNAHVPNGLNPAFYQLFGAGNPEWQNLNLSPNAPDAGLAWASAWHSATGERVDGAISIDTMALARLTAAAGIALTEVGGRQLSTPDQIADYASLGVYEEFPGQDLARKQHQAAVFSAVLGRLLGGGVDTRQLATPLAQSIADGHAWIFMTDPLMEQVLTSAGVTGSLADLADNAVQVRFNNLSGNKADFFLRPTVQTTPLAHGYRLTLHLQMDPALRSVTAPIVIHRLDSALPSGPGSRLQVLLSLGGALSAQRVSAEGNTTPANPVPYAGASVVATYVTVTATHSVTIIVDLRGPRPDLSQALAGALVHN
ncbi:MAG: DUF4012 domain-containing protein [Candidatus Nanopelagicales bacterium]